MSNLESYKKIFSETLSVGYDKLENLNYNDIPDWDSIGHMTLISNLEEKFDISIDTDDIVDFSSFSKGKEILKKYKIDL
jgi:acyl carrier protein